METRVRQVFFFFLSFFALGENRGKVHQREDADMRVYVRVHDLGLEVLGGDIDDIVLGGVEAGKDRLGEEQGSEGDSRQTVLHCCVLVCKSGVGGGERRRRGGGRRELVVRRRGKKGTNVSICLHRHTQFGSLDLH